MESYSNVISSLDCRVSLNFFWSLCFCSTALGVMIQTWLRNASSQTESNTPNPVRTITPPSAPIRSTAAPMLSARMDSEDPSLVSVKWSMHLLADVRVTTSMFCCHIRRFRVRSHFCILFTGSESEGKGWIRLCICVCQIYIIHLKTNRGSWRVTSQTCS